MRVRRNGISLIEVLIVVGILGLLVQLTLPAIEESRERARQMECQNNLRQLGVAVLVHESTYKRLPTGGWHYRWIGDPDRGSDKRQPGGWIYNILPFIEQQALHDLGKGQSSQAKRQSANQLCASPLKLLICPSRRSVKLYPFDSESPTPRNYDRPKTAAKTDYAANGGEISTKASGNPPTIELADTKFTGWINPKSMSGVIFQRSELKLSDIIDGTTKTYLIGEKYADPNRYLKGDVVPGDDQTMYVGYGYDTIRWAAHHDGRDLCPIRDEPHKKVKESFGSAHIGGCNFVMCDGSVRTISYDVDAKSHRQFANRADSEVINERK